MGKMWVMIWVMRTRGGKDLGCDYPQIIGVPCRQVRAIRYTCSAIYLGISDLANHDVHNNYRT